MRADHRVGQLTAQAKVDDVAHGCAQDLGNLAGRQEFVSVGLEWHQMIGVQTIQTERLATMAQHPDAVKMSRGRPDPAAARDRRGWRWANGRHRRSRYGQDAVIVERVRRLLETKGARTRDAEGRLIPTEPVTLALSRSQSYLDIQREFLARWRRV